MKGLNLSSIKSDEKLPPVHLWHPELCGDMDLVIQANGEWVHEGVPMVRASMKKMFSRILWLEEGEYYLVTPHEKVQIQVEDAPFLVNRSQCIPLENNSSNKSNDETLIQFVTSVDDVLTLGKDCDLWTEQGPQGERPYITMRYGMKAMLHRNVYYDLVNQGFEKKIDGKYHICIRSAGKEYSLGALDA
ncbi:DUF1285 domain-containing protein [Marinomonas sp. 2405UD68-3]|uniref:DUF1285 domain-containing protein n=1 Tax=Marinomonas sp. 2405UD68-3 TaxID=3391835 RepID=UPI0039C8C7BB